MERVNVEAIGILSLQHCDKVALLIRSHRSQGHTDTNWLDLTSQHETETKQSSLRVLTALNKFVYLAQGLHMIITLSTNNGDHCIATRYPN